jgi:hypothetical protein
VARFIPSHVYVVKAKDDEMRTTVKRIQDAVDLLKLAKEEVDQIAAQMAVSDTVGLNNDILVLSGGLVTLMQVTAGLNHSFAAILRTQVPEGFIVTEEPSEFPEGD